ncbi:M15 family metallopeptidase [uncultured Microbacterium sp.]|uniref:M15 family metallopeptidase n=1 Tax=uncultured Microbacterium sp. TaxID=191216 RepID=UPI002626CE29|nr:M15 family metallopeptidase [uncultured Microbacterium sp.]
MSATHSRHASRAPLAVKVALPIGVLFTAIASLATLGGALAEEPLPALVLPAPAAAMALPDVKLAGAPAADPCSDAGVQTAIAAGDDSATIAAFGGGEAFLEAVIAGNAPCISLSDPAREWVVVNKLRPLGPVDFAPASLVSTGLQATTGSTRMRPAVADALGRLAAQSQAVGAGRLDLNNGYRSYSLQQTTYSRFVRSEGRAGADAGSARPGHSEHQTGLAVDVVACSPGCGEMGQFAGTMQSAWVAAHAWEYGFIVRYENGATSTTGYMPEPWHLRYIGPELAKAYHDGGFHTLEAFFNLPAAPDYAP